ncbi:MAG TPA: hypothetical protein V6D08_02835 [Candidatus Obscuribacterales bacterium]
MYWRIRRVSPEQVARQYGVHAVCAVSILLNVLLIATRPNPKKEVGAEMKTNLEQFARNVTQHILDSSFISYEQSTLALLGNNMTPGELAPQVVKQMKANEQLPKTIEDLKATARTLEAQRQVSAIRIDGVVLGEPDERGLVPIQVAGQAAIHSADESVSGTPMPFRFVYKVGMWGPPNQPEVPRKPIVIDLKDLSGR